MNVKATSRGLTLKTIEYFNKIAKGHPRPASDKEFLAMADSPLDNVEHKDFVIKTSKGVSIRCRRYFLDSDKKSESPLPSMVFSPMVGALSLTL